MHRRRRSPPLTTATINGGFWLDFSLSLSVALFSFPLGFSVLYFFSHPALNGEFGMV
jgi:hypothetical protein|uniref:Uncharacterized protein n=1 Tax=Fagus sylvatica TaxID=28930 RepID=A0A2N9H2I1_FAGSY